MSNILLASVVSAGGKPSVVVSIQSAYLLAGQAPAASSAVSEQSAYLLSGQAPGGSLAVAEQIIYVIGA